MAVKIHCIEKPRLSGSFFRISSEDGKTADRLLQGHWWQAIAQDHNERDFLEFKANLLLHDAQGDPIRKAALIGDMVQSIAQIPDPIQRSVYIQECARIMDIDEQILISEVARRRLTSSGDRETDEFLRRQAAQQQRETVQPDGKYVRQIEAGSGIEALEREIVKYLLKYGHCSFDFKEGPAMVACNVAEVIFDELGRDGIEFRNPVYAQIMATYRTEWERLGTGVEVPVHCFLNHIDPEVCNASVDILTSDDNYVPSELWRRKEIHVESAAEMLAVGVPKAVTLYKSKVVEGMIKELQVRLGDETLPEEEQDALLQRLSGLNKVKVSIARKLQRLKKRKKGGNRRSYTHHCAYRVQTEINRKMCKQIRDKESVIRSGSRRLVTYN